MARHKRVAAWTCVASATSSYPCPMPDPSAQLPPLRRLALLPLGLEAPLRLQVQHLHLGLQHLHLGLNHPRGHVPTRMRMRMQTRMRTRMHMRMCMYVYMLQANMHC